MGSNIYLQKICEQCGKEFTARTTVTRFCSHTCSSRAYKDRTRKDKVEKIKTDTIRIKTKEIREIQARDVLTVSEVAATLSLSVKTVSTYRARLLEKLQLHSTSDLVRYALKKGWVK